MAAACRKQSSKSRATAVPRDGVAECGGLVNTEGFTANGVELQLAVGESQIDTLQKQLADLSRGRILLAR